MDLSLAEARRLALVAQGFGRGPAVASLADVRRVATTVLAIQIDSINVVVRSHYLPAYSRLGPYPRETVDDLAYGRRELFECWGHAACLMPVELYPILRYRMEAQRSASPWRPGSSAPDGTYIESVYRECAERGPITARDLPDAGARRGTWWGWNNRKIALEHLLACGLVAVAGRRGFERVYDIAERVIPRVILDAPAVGPEVAQKELLCRSAAALGIATAGQLEKYFGLHNHRVIVRGADGRRPRGIWRRLLQELVEERRLLSVAVEDWQEPGYMAPGVRVPRTVDARALLSPFDSFMWGSARQCCGFRQHLSQQLYVPAERRIYGYYVLPFLLGDTLVARCDLKADRERHVLRVQGAFVEPGHDAKWVGAELMQELRRLQSWLELDDIEVADKGDLAPVLRRSL